MNVIMQDAKTFYKPITIYLVAVQVLIWVILNASTLMPQSEGYLNDYSTAFLVVICYVAILTYTVLFVIFYNTKSNIAHLKMIELTDGYGLYRYASTVLFIITISLNAIIGAQLNGVETLEIIGSRTMYELISINIIIVLLLFLVVLSLATSRQKKPFKKISVIICTILILVGLYGSSTLYYFNNPRQGAAVVLLTYVPLAATYLAIKDRDSYKRIYKYIIYTMCVMTIAFSTYTIATSDFAYYRNIKEQEELEIEFKINDQPEIIESTYGDIISLNRGDETQGKSYSLTTDNFTYRVNISDTGNIKIDGYGLNSANQFNIYYNHEMNSTLMQTSIYDEEVNSHQDCQIVWSDISSDDNCNVPEEVYNVFDEMLEIFKERI